MAYQSGLTRQAGFRPAKRAKFDKQRATLDAQGQRNDAQRSNEIKQENSVNEFNVKQAGKDVEALAGFSKTLTEHLVKRRDEQNEEAMQRGIMSAYTDGVSQEEQDAFEADEAAGEQLNKDTISLANKVEKQSGNVFVGQKVRQMSGWEAYGYAQGMAQMGGEDYTAHLANLQTRLDGATDPAEYNAILSESRSEYMRKYNRLNPALLNKHMFPAMRRAEARVAAGWTAQRTKRIQEERLESSNQQLSIGLRGGNIEESVQNYMADVGASQGSKAAREGLVRQVESLIKGGAISTAAAERLLDTQVQAADGSGLVSIRNIVPGLANYKQWFIDRDTKQYNNDRNTEKIETQQYIDQFNDTVRQREAEGQDPFTNKEIEALKEDFKRDTGREPPSVYDDYTTAQERDQKQEQERIEEILGPSGRGYLIESDLEGMSFATRNKYNNRLKADQDASIASSEFKTEAAKIAEALAATEFKGTIGKDDPKTTQYQNYVRRAKDAYDRYYRTEIRKGETPDQAHKNALAQMERNGAAQTYTIPDVVGPNTAVQREVLAADTWLRNNPEDWRSQTIPGTEKALAELQAAVKSKGPLRIPQAYKAIASSRKDMTAWDIANAQLKAATGEGLKPNGSNYAEQISPEINRLLTFKPTINRTRRAMVESGSAADFLNLIASEESAGHGDYDAYNLGGSNNGNTPHGSGNSNDGKFGKPLTRMTVGEVIGLQNTGQIHATGRYQFIGGTLKETAEYAGIGMDEIYSPEIQDALALGRAKWRRENDPGIAGLRREWVGLNNVPDHVLEQHYTAMGRPTYDQPQNTTPGVQLSLSSFASQARGQVTYDVNQPGIDVFFEDKQFPAVLPGRVKEVSSQYNADGSGYGNFIVVESIDPTTGQTVDVLYSHLESPAKYKAGQSINTGQIIGRQGGTGSVQSVDGTIASIDFLAPAPAGSGSMTPYSGYDALRRNIAQQFGA